MSCAPGEGITVFMTTHYMDEAEHCDRIGIMDPPADRPRYAAALKAGMGGDVVRLRTADNAAAAGILRARTGRIPVEEDGALRFEIATMPTSSSPSCCAASRSPCARWTSPAHAQRRVPAPDRPGHPRRGRRERAAALAAASPRRAGMMPSAVPVAKDAAATPQPPCHARRN